MNKFAYAYIALRLIFNYLYLTTTTRSGSYARTAAFNIALGLCINTIIKSCRAINK